MSSIVEDAKDVLTKKVSSKAESIREMLRAFELKWSLPVLFKEIEEKARRGGEGEFKALTDGSTGDDFDIETEHYERFFCGTKSQSSATE